MEHLLTDRDRYLEKAAQTLQLAQGDLESAGEIKLAYEVGLLRTEAEDLVYQHVVPAP